MAKADADGNLLFGVLALQMDFISRDALIAAMNAWVLEKQKPLGQILRDQEALDDDTQALLEALVRKHLALHGGDPEKSLATLGTIGSVREEIRRIADPDLHASLAHVGMARVPGDDPYATRTPSLGTTTSSGLRFTILRPHARGGLGAVFVARDEELHREVALKEIQDRHADDPASRARFVREAEITGGLEHPGIVPVYGLGCYGDGRPFYAMRLIRGDDLGDAIRRFHGADGPGRDPGARRLSLQKLVRRFLDVCNALAYAHSRGVLHRDLKPGNVMLGPFGETLVVDWGLAKAMDRPDSGTSGAEHPLIPPSSRGGAETLPGRTVGTPSYMSPEQAAGQLDRLGPASDVYSLGATLYALLTGHAPVEDPDVGRVLHRVQRGDFAPPRQIDRLVPAALEAICLKAMALRPEERYPSVRALTDDLEHWLADERVSAYREPVPARLRRWGRRHLPLVAGAAALVMATTVALAVGVVLLGREQARTEQQRQQTELARLAAQAKADELQVSLYYTKIGLAEGEFASNNLGRFGELLDQCPPHLRRWEWSYLKRLPHRDRPILCEHRGVAFSVAFSPDGRHVASAAYDGTVTVTDVASGQEVRRFRSSLFFGPVFDVAFSPDGQQVAAAVSTLFAGAVKVWDLSTGREVSTLRDRRGGVITVAFSPDGQQLASAGWDEAITLWDRATGQEVRTLRGHTNPINGVDTSRRSRQACDRLEVALT